MRHFRPPASSRDPRYGKAREALLVLGAVAAEDADYATKQNGRGFSKSDSTKGHDMARMSVTSVLSSNATFEEVTKLAARYRRQAGTSDHLTAGILRRFPSTWPRLLREQPRTRGFFLREVGHGEG